MPRNQVQKPPKLTRYEIYEAEWRDKTRSELREEFDHQQSVVNGSAVGTGIAALAIPLTMGLSAIAIGGTAPAIHIARKKRAVIQKLLDTSAPAPIDNRRRPTQQVPVDVDQFALSQQLPRYTARASASDPSLLREPSQRREKEVYVPETSVDGPPAYSETAAAASKPVAESSRNVHFAPPAGPPPGRSAQPLTVNPFADTEQRSSQMATDGNRDDNDVYADTPHLRRSSTQASSIYEGRHNGPAVSLMDTPISPIVPHAPRQGNININEAFTTDIAKQGQVNVSVNRYDSIAGANPFVSRMDSVVVPSRS